MRTGQHIGPWRRVVRTTAKATALSLLIALPAAAGPIGAVEGTLPDGVAVIDLRDEDTCYDSSLTGARCLPAEWVLTEAGDIIAFHQLRWLLGTLGLDGSETLVIYGPDPDEALGFAALAYLAGQSQVLVYEGDALEDPTGGETRSFSREVIYTASMRIESVTIDDQAPGPLNARLIDFAKHGGTVALAPET